MTYLQHLLDRVKALEKQQKDLRAELAALRDELLDGGDLVDDRPFAEIVREAEKDSGWNPPLPPWQDIGIVRPQKENFVGDRAIVVMAEDNPRTCRKVETFPQLEALLENRAAWRWWALVGIDDDPVPLAAELPR